MRYFVSFCYEEEGRIGFGHTAIEMDHVVTEYRDIIEMERRLEEKIAIDHPILLDYKLLGSPALEYAKCVDVETLRVTGSGMTFAPEININVVSGGGAGMSAEEVARKIQKAVISQISRVSKGQE